MNQKIKTNYHTHTYLCKHARGKPIEYVKKAIDLEYEEIAITDHGPLNDEILKAFYTRRMNFNDFYQKYLPDLEVAKNYVKSLNNPIKLYTGVEIEYFKSMNVQYRLMLNHLDFLLLGQHHFLYQNRYCHVYDRLTDDEILFYGEVVVQAIETGLFKIIAHPDIYCHSRDFDYVCEITARKIIEAAKRHHVAIEFNVNGIRNSIRKNTYYPSHHSKTVTDLKNFAYPRREFYEIVKEYDIPVMINDDCHTLENLQDQYTKIAYELVNKIGLKIVTHFDI